MKNYQQALHDADILCRSKPHWPAVWCLHATRKTNQTACSQDFSLGGRWHWWGHCWVNIVVLSGLETQTGRSFFHRMSLEGPLHGISLVGIQWCDFVCASAHWSARACAVAWSRIAFRSHRWHGITFPFWQWVALPAFWQQCLSEEYPR